MIDDDDDDDNDDDDGHDGGDEVANCTWVEIFWRF